jgi:hypothetical protein
MRRTILIAVAAAAALAWNVGSAGAIHPTTFKAKRASCGVIKGQRAMGCRSPVLPGRHGFIKLGPSGPAHLSERGECPFRDCDKRSRRLPRSKAWRRVGVTCRVYSFGLRCENFDNGVHHFVLRRHSWARG